MNFVPYVGRKQSRWQNSSRSVSSGRGDKQRGYYRPGEKNPGAVSCGRRQGKRKTGRISYGSLQQIEEVFRINSSQMQI